MSRIPNDADTIHQAISLPLISVIQGSLIVVWIGYPMLTETLFFFKQKTAYDLGLGIPAEPLFRSDPKFFACLVRFESSSVPTTLPTAYDVYPLDGRHDGGYYTVKDCVTIDVLPRTPGNNVYVGFMVWSNFTATKCRGLVSLNQVIKEIICLQPLK